MPANKLQPPKGLTKPPQNRSALRQLTKSTTNGKPVRPRKPLWNGPHEDGITFSLLSKFINCRERFRKRVVEGLVEDEGFKHALEFGSLWHAAEEAHSGGKLWLPALTKYFNHLNCTYPGADRAIRKWYDIAKLQFPIYIDEWKKHQDEKGRKPLLEEIVFRVPYTLPSGRTVILRGKWDAVMLLAAPTKKEPELYKHWMEHWPKAKFGITNQENKTKGEIDEVGILHTVSKNLQTMIYHFALHHASETGSFQFLNLERAAGLIQAITDGIPITGVLYNVIRRPLSDRFAIKQKKTETEKQFYARLEELIRKDPKHYFMRWRVLLTPDDISGFQRDVLDPLLEQLCDWWEWIKVDPYDPWRSRTLGELSQQPQLSPNRMVPTSSAAVLPEPNRIHWQAPWGVYDSLASGFRGDYFEYLTTGREYGLRYIKSLYPELEGSP